LDTNIVLDLLDNGRKNHLYAVEILDYTISNCLEILISEDMLTTIYYINKDKQTTFLCGNDDFLKSMLGGVSKIFRYN